MSETPKPYLHLVRQESPDGSRGAEGADPDDGGKEADAGGGSQSAPF